MVLRIPPAPALLLASLLSTALTAQPPAAPVPQQPAPQNPVAGAPAAAPAAQDPDRPQKSPAERLEELQRELKRLEREIVYVQERIAKSSSLLASKLGNRSLAPRAIDAGLGTAANPVPAPAPAQVARLLSEDERKGLATEVMMVVDGRPVTDAELKNLVDYLATVPASGELPMREQRALLELIRIHSVTSHFSESAAMAEQAARSAATDLANGGAFDEVMNRYGGNPGAQQDGKVQITRFCPYGLLVEQAAFSTKEGERSQPVRGLGGWALVQVDKVTKGPTPDADVADVHLILLPYHNEPQELEKARTLAVTGQVSIAVRSAEDLAKLPPFLQPKANAPKQPKAPMLPVELPKEDAPPQKDKGQDHPTPKQDPDNPKQG